MWSATPSEDGGDMWACDEVDDVFGDGPEGEKPDADALSAETPIAPAESPRPAAAPAAPPPPAPPSPAPAPRRPAAPGAPRPDAVPDESTDSVGARKRRNALAQEIRQRKETEAQAPARPSAAKVPASRARSSGCAVALALLGPLTALFGVMSFAGGMFGRLFRSRGARRGRLPEGDAAKTPPAKLPEEQTDQVQCSVYSPPATPPGDMFLVQVLAHTPAQEERARQIALEADEDAKRLGVRTLDLPVPRESVLSFHLSMPSLEVDAPAQHVVWRGRPESAQFAVSVPEGAKPSTVIGTVSAFLDSIPVGQVRFKVKIAAGREEASPRPEPAGDSAHTFRRAFISYATKDRDKVLARVQMLKTLKIDFFQDVLSLEPGARWEGELYKQIDQSDLFLLFWSSAARDSQWVMREAAYAAERQRASREGLPAILPVIVEGPPVVEPPSDLSHLHFNDNLLYVMNAN
jgi:hypothetical protein